MSHPTAPGGENGRIDSIAGSDAKITSPWSIPSRQARKQAVKSGCPARAGSFHRTRGFMNSP